MFTLEDIVPFNLEDMEYGSDNYQEYYHFTFDNGDVLWISHYRKWDRWDWRVGTSDDFPQGYANSHPSKHFSDAQEVLDDFFECFRGRTWKSRSEIKAECGIDYYRCVACGWEGTTDEMEHVTVYEDYGDVSCAKCPSCGQIEYDGMELFEFVRNEPAM